MNTASIASEKFGQFLWTASWQAAALAVVVAIVCRLWHRQIKSGWQFAMWSLVFVRLACPVLPPSALSVQNLWAPPEATAVADNAPVISEQPTAQPISAQGEDIRIAGDEVVVDAAELEPAKEASVAASPPVAADRTTATSFTFSFWPTAIVVWGTIVLLLLLRQSLLRHRLIQLSAHWRKVTDAQTLELLEDCCRSLQIRRPPWLFETEQPIGPAVLGICKPRIIIPDDVLAESAPEELRMLLLHELQHVRRWDVLWDRLATLLAIVHWFNPAVWWARLRMKDAREQVCDAAVLQHIAVDQSTQYGHLVMKLAECRDHRKADAVLVGMLGQSRSLSRRIEQIAAYRPSSPRHTVIGLASIVMLIAAGLTSAQKPDAAKPTETETGSTAASRNLEEDQAYSLAGQCQDGEQQPMQDVRVRLFRVSTTTDTRELVEETTTNGEGMFQFKELPAPVPAPGEGGVSDDYVLYETYYVLAATKAGYSSSVVDRRAKRRGKTEEDISVVLQPAGKLTGRVTDPDGKPIAGANVYLRAFPYSSLQPIEDVQSAVTDEDGRYEIDDLAEWDPSKTEPRKVGENTFEQVSGCYFSVYHPDYGVERPLYSKIPSEVNVTLVPAAIIEGKVVDRVTGQPANNVRVSIQGVHPTNGWRAVRTNADGTYRIPAVNAGTYNIMGRALERTCVAHDSVKLESGKTYSDLDLELIEGSWIEGRVVDAETGEPYDEFEGRRLRVAVYGPANPKSGAAVTSSAVEDNGRFAIRVPPGVNYPYIMTSNVWLRTEDRDRYKEGIQVGEGKLVVLDFRVLSEPPRKKPKLSPVRLPIPAPGEREASAAIRRLGGWYEVNETKHVVEVNMVYHYENKDTDKEVRHNNDQNQTDEALLWVKHFPKLKRLLVHEGQASDDGLKQIAGLSELEMFFAWDAHSITDEGVQHLSGLKALKNVHISNSRIGDGALEVFGQLPNVERLSLQGNHFTDAGVRHLKNLKSLKSLWMGLGESRFTDRACEALGELTQLEELSMQRCTVTDAGIKKLSKLTGLRKLNLGGTNPDEPEGITEDSVEVLTQFRNLQSLSLSQCRLTDEGARRLLALPKLQNVSLSGSSITRETKAELKEMYPEMRINITGR